MPVAPEYLHLVYPGETFPAYLYGRASHDPTKRGRSVDTQLHEGRELCDRFSWPVVGVFDKDVDRSASRHAKRQRADFEAMLDGIAAGKCRIVVAWEASRYYRDLEAYVRLRSACLAANVLLCYNGAVYDLSKREDRKATAQDALQAEDEAEGIRDRNLRTMRRTAAAGTPHGRILYGYARRYDPDTGDLLEQYPHPDRSLIVAQIFERVAAGESEYAIIRSLNAKAATDPEASFPGRTWDDYHLRNMLRNPGYIGRRIHQGQDIGKATWPAIVGEETFHAVQRILSDPGRANTYPSSVQHLLSGIAVCGVCPGRPILRVSKNRGYLTYTCRERFDTALREDRFDAYVEDAVIRMLESDAAVTAFQSNGADSDLVKARNRLNNLTTQLNEARVAANRRDDDGIPELSLMSLVAMEKELVPQIKKAEAVIESATVPPLLRGLVGRDDVDAAWDALTMEQKRAVFRLTVNIDLFPARSKGVRRIEPGRIKLTWFWQPGFVRTDGARPGPAPAPQSPDADAEQPSGTV